MSFYEGNAADSSDEWFDPADDAVYGGGVTKAMEADYERARRKQQGREAERQGNVLDAAGKFNGKAGECQLDDGWEDPVPLGLIGEPIPLPSSSGAFGRALWDMADAVAEFRQVPRSAPFLAALPIAAGAAGGRCAVEVTPGWTEQLSIYTGVGLPPGERKSATHGDMRAPLVQVQKELGELARVEEEVKAILRQKAKDELEAAETSAREIDQEDRVALQAAAKDVVAARERLEAAQEGTADIRLISDDTTDEALARKIAQQGGRQIMLSAEGKIFRIMAGLYSGGAPNFNMYLKAHDGDSATITRNGAEELQLDRPVLNISLMFQPSILAEMGRTSALRANGLIGRFLLDVPKPMAGYRRDVSEVEPIPTLVRDAWDKAVRGIARRWYLQQEPAILPLTPEAEILHRRARQEAEEAIRPDGPLGHFPDWGSKLAGRVARMAAVLQLVEDPQSIAVSGEAMETVQGVLMPWLIAANSRALAVINGSSVPSYVTAVLSALKQRSSRLAGNATNVRSVYRLRGVHDKQITTEQVREALDRLADHGYMRPTGTRNEFHVHPRLAALEV